MVITVNKYDSSSRKEGDRINIWESLNIRQMEQAVKMVHLPIPKCDQLQQEFEGSDSYSVIDYNHVFHHFEIDKKSSQLFVFTAPFGL